ncbi:MAG: glycerol-3-phosphate 1-O-acyltransferase PlsY [Lachnospiraceae bacterium]|nr:glycerol-3-phosphate 1-O-acyltransferase PlsY [Lachnospiraceae bacterium]
MITARIISILIGYFAGLFQTGVIYGKITGTDLRKTGSGNTGTTNSIRVLGWKAGVIVCAGDLFKAVVAIIVVWLLFRHGEGPVKLYMLYAGLGAVLGHDFPFYLKFKGGKGIATTVGVICACNPLMVPICAACFFAAVIPTGFMSLGSLAMCLGFLVQTILFGVLGPESLLGIPAAFHAEYFIIAAIITGLAFIQHRQNINRLIHGQENKFRPGKK